MIKKQLRLLGITEAHCNRCGLPLQQEAESLTDAGCDIFERPVMMTPETLGAWQKMQAAAELELITLELVSAYRSVEYQCGLIQRKLENGLNIDEILAVNAIPGYSEHHSGRALDLTTPGATPLEETFDQTPAFDWLDLHAADFGFSLSYPKDNPSGIDYEPWHWCYGNQNASGDPTA